MTERKHKAKAPSKAEVKLSFSTEPNLEVLEAVRKMLLTNYEETNKE